MFGIQPYTLHQILKVGRKRGTQKSEIWITEWAKGAGLPSFYCVINFFLYAFDEFSPTKEK